jgi:hypothetical protein
MEASYRLPKNFRDMIQIHLATRPHILYLCSVNNPTPTPSIEAMESLFVVWPFNKPRPLPATPHSSLHPQFGIAY